MKKLPLTLGLLLAGGAALAQDGGAAAGTAVQAAADAAGPEGLRRVLPAQGVRSDAPGAGGGLLRDGRDGELLQ